MKPEPWRLAAMGALAHIEMGQSPPSEFVVDHPGYGVPFLQGNAEFTDRFPQPRLWCRRPTKMAREGDALISVRAPVGALNRADRDYCIGRGLAAVRFTGVDPEFGYYALARFSLALQRLAQGTTFQAVGGAELRELMLPICPTPEQRRIAEILNTVDEAIRKTEGVIAKLQQLKQGLLHDLLTRGIDRNGELRDPERHADEFDDSALGRIPRDWVVRSLGTLCDLLNGLAFRPEDWGREGLPIIRIQNLNGSTEFNYCKRRVPEQYVIPPGSILFSWSGNRGTSFGPYLWNGPTGLLNQHIFRVTPTAKQDVAWFLFALDEVRQRVERAAHGGSGLVHVRRGDLLGYLVATPSAEEQRRIGRTVSTMNERIEEEQRELAKLNDIKAGVMDDLLTGRVRIAFPDEATA